MFLSDREGWFFYNGRFVKSLCPRKFLGGRAMYSSLTIFKWADERGFSNSSTSS